MPILRQPCSPSRECPRDSWSRVVPADADERTVDEVCAFCEVVGECGPGLERGTVVHAVIRPAKNASAGRVTGDVAMAATSSAHPRAVARSRLIVHTRRGMHRSAPSRSVRTCRDGGAGCRRSPRPRERGSDRRHCRRRNDPRRGRRTQGQARPGIGRHRNPRSRVVAFIAPQLRHGGRCVVIEGV